MFPHEVLRAGAQALGITLDEKQIEQFEHYARRLYEANQRMNLTAIPPEEVVTRHFLDSLTLVSAWEPFAGAQVLDVGAGAGLPGLPLKLAFPQIHLALLDSRHAPVQFMHTLCEELELEHITLMHTRAEEAGKQARWREQFDVVTARAVAHLWVLAEWTLPFVRVGGMAIWLKRPTQRAEVEQAREQIQRLGGAEPEVIQTAVPHSDIVNLLVRVQKVVPTPPQYPRATARVLREARQFKSPAEDD